MSTKWSSQVLGKSGSTNFGELLKDEFSVVLLQGKNTFGDMIYCYVKVNFPNIEKLEATLKTPNTVFTPSDFGEVLAAGKGHPTDEVRAEIATMYKVLESARPKASAGGPAEKKKWDEY